MQAATQMAAVGSASVGLMAVSDTLPDVWSGLAKMGISGVVIWVLWNLYRQERAERLAAQEETRALATEFRAHQQETSQKLVDALAQKDR
jgi:hypothetical protein